MTPLKDEPRARLVAARYSASSPKIPVTLEIDAPGQEEGDADGWQRSLVEVKFDRAGEGAFEKAPGSPFRGLRDQAVEFKGEGDAIVFKTKVKDRVIELDAEGINGGRLLKVRLLSANQSVIRIADEQTSKEERVALFNPGDENKFAPLAFDKTTYEVAAALVFDSTPVEELKIANIPPEVKPATRLEPRLQFKPRPTARQAPIEKVYFFFGQPDKDHKVADSVQKIEGAWDKKEEAYVPKEDMIAPAETGRAFVGVVVETATGALASRKQAVIVTNNPGVNPGAANVLTTITGKVIRGDLPQPGAIVTLAKAKSAPGDKKKQIMAKDDGKFEFRDVEPGDYVISSGRNNAFAVEVVTLEKNQEKLDVTLKLLVK